MEGAYPGQEQAAEQGAEHADRQEEGGAGGYPACSIAGDADARYDHVDVGMMGKRGSPCMEYGGDADPGTEMRGISGESEHRIGRGLAQQSIDPRFVTIGDRGELVQHRKHEEE